MWSWVNVKVVIFGLVTLCAACEPAPPTEIRVLSVQSPKAGRIQIDGVKYRVETRSTLEIEVSQPPPYSLTFIDDSNFVTLTGIDTYHVDLSGLLGDAQGIPGGREEVSIRPTVGAPDDMVVVVDGQVYRPTSQTELWTFQIPKASPGSLIAFWSEFEGAPHLGLKALLPAGDLQGRAISISPNLALDREVPLLVQGSPNGWMTAELVFDGIRTGIKIADGLVGPSKARAIPAHPSGEDFGLSWWITLTAKQNLPSPSIRTTALELQFFRPSVALNWALRADVDPPLRDSGNVVHIDLTAEKLLWTEAALSATWLELDFVALGTCQETSASVRGPTRTLEAVPDVTLDRIRDAPWVRVSSVAVNRRPWDWLRFISAGGLGLDEPRFLTVDERQSLEGYWQLGPGCDDEHPLEGHYTAIDNQSCELLAVKPVYRIDRCGQLINLTPAVSGVSLCGEFSGRRFRERGGGQLAYRLGEQGRIHIGDDRKGVTLLPAPRTDTAMPRYILGAWSRYEATEQEVKVEDGRTLGGINQPVRIAYGEASESPWLEAIADGRLYVRAKFIDAPGVITRSGDGFAISVYGTGCADISRRFAVEQNDLGVLLTEELETDDPTIRRIRRFQFWR